MIYSSERALAQEAFRDFEIRSGRSEDIGAMALLTERAIAGREGKPLPVTLSKNSEDYNDLANRQHYAGYWSLLAFDNDQLAGFTAGYPGTWKGEDDGSNSEYLWLLMVDPHYQKRGLGRALLELAGATAYEDGASNVALYVVTGNQRAIDLYESEEYKHAGAVISDKQGELAKYVLELS